VSAAGPHLREERLPSRRLPRRKTAEQRPASVEAVIGDLDPVIAVAAPDACFWHPPEGSWSVRFRRSSALVLGTSVPVALAFGAYAALGIEHGC